ncbi:hypothetical protein [uncultured Sunxiuqinia sp.]|uniref:hypothetical protein n=1 Tax=uncultured Sunxiuqinia sp. TaxID=1573825 RepID=UPI0026320F59|nr:hypothetical protein [uncultured Sunxiuqinia sp.]
MNVRTDYQQYLIPRFEQQCCEIFVAMDVTETKVQRTGTDGLRESEQMSQAEGSRQKGEGMHKLNS